MILKSQRPRVISLDQVLPPQIKMFHLDAGPSRKGRRWHRLGKAWGCLPLWTWTAGPGLYSLWLTLQPPHSLARPKFLVALNAKPEPKGCPLSPEPAPPTWP